MGLTLVVGFLSELSEIDPEGLQARQDELAQLNTFLAQAGLPRHEEPPDCPVWSCDMLGYYGLHALRRVAAHLFFRGQVPPDVEHVGFDEDPLEKRYYEDHFGKPGLVRRLLGRKPRRSDRFEHLMVHGDAEGYYLPADFARVLFPADSLGIAGGCVGSVPRLQMECRELAGEIGIPDGLNLDSTDLEAAIESAGEAANGWRAHAISTYSCLALLEACDASLRTGAAIVFA